MLFTIYIQVRKKHTNQSKYFAPCSSSYLHEISRSTYHFTAKYEQVLPTAPIKKSLGWFIRMSASGSRYGYNVMVSGSSSSYMILHGIWNTEWIPIRTISDAVRCTRGVKQARVMSRLGSAAYSFQLTDQYLQVFFFCLHICFCTNSRTWMIFFLLCPLLF